MIDRIEKRERSKCQKRKKNGGYITVEASIIVPLFLFFMLGMTRIYMIFMAEAHVHQALASTAEYMAQCAYIEKKSVNTLIATGKWQVYLGEDHYVEQVISGGKQGVRVKVKWDTENEKIMLLTATYQVKLSLPLLGTYSTTLSNQIKQKAFVGFSKEEFNEEDVYVYVTPNREAYHLRRDCTHLLLDVRMVSSVSTGNYSPCHYCGIGAVGRMVYIAKNGEVYHCRRDCVGLKRTVRRMKRSTVEGLGVCSRCGA